MTIKYIQLVGPCTGLPDYNFPAFNEAAMILRANGFIVANPAELYNEIMLGMREAGIVDQVHGPSWRTMMLTCITHLFNVDTIVRLEGWEKSKGANLENHVAKALDLNIVDWPDFRKHMFSQIRSHEENQPIINTP